MAFQPILGVLIKSVIKGRVNVPSDTANAQEGCFKKYLAIVNYVLKRYETEDNTATVVANIQTFKQRDMTAHDYTQQ